MIQSRCRSYHCRQSPVAYTLHDTVKFKTSKSSPQSSVMFRRC